MSEFPELESLRIRMDEQTAEHQRARIRSELAETPQRRRWWAGLAVAAILVLPATAVAAEGSVPGDVLYPVKRAFEPIVALVVRDLVVDHRIDEAEELDRRGASQELVEQAIRDARSAISLRGADVEDTARLDRIEADGARSERDGTTTTTPGEGRVMTDRPATTTATTVPPTTGHTRDSATPSTRPPETEPSDTPTTDTTSTDTTTSTRPSDTTTTAPSDRPRDG